ncbi:MAG: phage tail tape measure protein, partial [Clostridia bacterium]
MASGKEYEMLFSLNAKLSGSFQSTFGSAKTSLSGMQDQINSLNKAQGDISAYQKQQAAVVRTKEKLELLQKQYANLKADTDGAGESSAAMKNKLLDKEKQIDKTTSSLKSQTDKLDALGSALSDASVDTGNLTDASRRLATEIDNLKNEQVEAAKAAAEMGDGTVQAVSEIQQALAAAGIIEGFQQLYEGIRTCADSSVAFESAMTGVAKTTDMTDAELKAMAGQIKELSTIIPVTTTELAGIGEVAGQLGIQKENLLDFSEVMAQLATSTTMTSEEAATMLAQFANITQMDPSYYSNLGSTIVDLGNNYATTEQKITDMSQGIAASASLAGMSEADIAGLSAAVTSLGIETAAGSTSMSKMITDINTAVETGKGLTDFALVANMTCADFSKAWGEDAASALAQFVTGLNDTERNGRSATVILSELGITEARLQRMVLSLAGSGNLMNRALSTANTAWSENTALQNEASKRYATTESQMSMLSNAFGNLKIAIGDNFTPVLQGLAPVATDALTEFTQFIEQNPALVQAVTATVGVFATATVALTAYAAIAKVAAGVSALLTASIPGAKTILAVTAGVALLAGAIAGIASASSNSAYDLGELDAEFETLNAKMEEQQRIADLCDEYKALSKELGDTADSAKRLSEYSDTEMNIKAEPVPDVYAQGFIAPDDPGISLTAEQTHELLEMGFLSPDDPGIELTAEQAKTLYAQGFIASDDVGITLTAGQTADLYEKGFLAGDDSGVTITAEQYKTLEANGFLKDDKALIDGAINPDFTAIDPKEFVTGTDITITPNLEGWGDIQAKVNTLKSSVDATSGEFEKQKAALAALEEQKASLDAMFSGNNREYSVVVDYQNQNKLSPDGIVGKNTLASLQEDLDKVNASIITQKEQVSLLDGEYTALNAEYLIAQGQAEELAAKKARLVEVTGELNAASGGYIAALGEESEVV